MRDISRKDFLKYGAAAVAVPSFMDLAPGAMAAKTKLPPPIDLKTLVTKSQAEGGTCLFYAGSSDLALAVLRNPYLNSQVISLDGGIYPR